MSTGNLGRKLYFWKNCRCSYRFHKWAEDFGSSGENFSAALWWLPSTCPRDHTEKNFFKKKSDNFHNSRTLSRCFSAFSRRFSSRVDRKKLSKFLIISGHWVKNFRLFVEKIEPGLPELLSTCLQEQFERYIFLKKSLKFLLSFSDTEQKNFGFLSIFSMGLSIVFSTCP